MMADPPQDEARLRATEAQMRRALGLNDPTDQTADPKAPTASNGLHRSRHFVRSSEVPVTIIHRGDGNASNELEVARETIRTLNAARDELERSLATAQGTIRDLETKLAHEHIARNEAAERFEADKQ